MCWVWEVWGYSSGCRKMGFRVWEVWGRWYSLCRSPPHKQAVGCGGQRCGTGRETLAGNGVSMQTHARWHMQAGSGVGCQCGGGLICQVEKDPDPGRGV